jgi:hypothetical protein
VQDDLCVIAHNRQTSVGLGKNRRERSEALRPSLVDMASTPPTPDPESKRPRRRWYQDVSDKLKNKLHIPSRSTPQSSRPPSTSPARSPTPALPSSSGFRNAAWNGLEATLEGLKKSTELVPPIHSAISGLASFLSLFEVRTLRFTMT